MALRRCALVLQPYHAYLRNIRQFHVLQGRWYADSATCPGQPRSLQDRARVGPSSHKSASDEDITSVLTADDCARIHQLFDTHLDVQTIAKQTGLGPLVVWKYLYDGGMLSFRSSRPPATAWTDAEHVKLAELVHRRLPLRVIAAHLERSESSVHSYTKVARPQGGENVYSLEDRDSAIQLQKGGMSRKEIARSLGWPVSVVRHMLRAKSSRAVPTWDQIKKVFHLKETGMSWAKIAENLGIQSYVPLLQLHSYRMRAKKPTGRGKLRPWTDSERHELLRLRSDLGLSYTEIAKTLTGRSVQALAMKYPSLDGSVEHSRMRYYSAEERTAIVKLRAAGLSWGEIAVRLPGRSRPGVQRFYHAALRGRYTIHEDGSVQWQDTPQEHSKVKNDSSGSPGKTLSSSSDADTRNNSVTT